MAARAQARRVLLLVLATAAAAAHAAAATAGPPAARPVHCSGAATLTSASGVVATGGGRYLEGSNCTWVLAPPPQAGGSGVTLVFERFKTVMDDDFLFVRDGTAEVPPGDTQVGEPLAMYTGVLPTPFAVHFDAPSLRLSFFSAPGNRADGFRIRYLSGGACYNACGGGANGTCDGGLCRCEPGRAGADCSVVVQGLRPGPGVRGTLGVDEVRYFRVDVPPGAGAMAVEMTLPGGHTGARPLLLLANGTSESAVYDTYATTETGACTDDPSSCSWCAGCGAGGAGGAPAPPVAASVVDPRVHLAGPTTDYIFSPGGNALIQPSPPYPLFPSKATRLPTDMPTEQFYTRKDYRAFDTRADYHAVRVEGPDLAPGAWYVGVKNTGPIVLPSFLGTSITKVWWGESPGHRGATEPVDFHVTVRLGSEGELCPLDCGGNGECVMGRCVCQGEGNATERARFAGPHCGIPVKALTDGEPLVESQPLPVGSWAYYFVPAPEQTAGFDQSLLLEVSHQGSPEARPLLFANLASTGGPPGSRGVRRLRTQAARRGERTPTRSARPGGPAAPVWRR